MPRRFTQVDVFTSELGYGNPVAVVHDAEGLDDAALQRFAAWTNLSETTFLLPPTDPAADYRLRIFTPGGELPFAGHPTLGSCHAWLEAGGEPGRPDVVVQECGAGLVDVRRGERLSFAGPPLRRSGPADDADLDRALRALRLEAADVVDAAWVDNGPGWMGLLLADAAAVLAVRPDFGAFDDLKLGIAGLRATGAEHGEGDGRDDTRLEVRAFCPGYGPEEDPVTGSLNAGLGQWLAGTVLPTSYVAAQGAAIGRRGRVHVRLEGDVGTPGAVVWVGGDTHTVVAGDVGLGD